MNTHVKQALRAGWKISPIAAGKKAGVYLKGNSWKNTIETAEEAAGYPPDCNWAFCPGINGCVVLDIDIKNGSPGRMSLQALEKRCGALPQTLTVRTPSGGTHYYFSSNGSTISDQIGSIAEGIDVRASNGYVVLFGSALGKGRNKKTYDIIIKPPGGSLQNLPTLPVKWQNLLNQQKPKQLTADCPELPPGSITKGSRDNFLTRQAGILRRSGLPKEAILSCLMEISETLCSPHEPRMVKKIARSICRYDPKADNSYLTSLINDIELKAKFSEALEGQESQEQESQEQEGFSVKSISDMKLSVPLTPRPWMVKRRFLRQNITVTGAQGGTGKSTLAFAEGLSMALGRGALTGQRVFTPGPVWYHSTEDSDGEILRKLHAYLQYYNIERSDIPFYTSSSATNDSFILCKEDHGSLVIDYKKIASIIKTIKDNNIQLLIVDPFVRAHNVNENDNNKIDAVMHQFSRIAQQGNCAIHLIHHSTKAKEISGDPNALRGAGALVNAARIVHTLTHYEEAECKRLGIKYGRYIVLQRAKCNLLPPQAGKLIYERKGISLPEITFASEASGGCEDQEVGVVLPVSMEQLIDQATDRNESSGLTEVEYEEIEAVLLQAMGSSFGHQLKYLWERAGKENQERVESLLPGQGKMNVKQRLARAVRVHSNAFDLVRKKDGLYVVKQGGGRQG